MEPPDPNNPIRLKCIDLRNKIRDVGAEVWKAKDDYDPKGHAVLDENGEQMLANYTLAFRHLEDARMRLGKVIQYLEGGTSIFDK